MLFFYPINTEGDSPLGFFNPVGLFRISHIGLTFPLNENKI